MSTGTEETNWGEPFADSWRMLAMTLSAGSILSSILSVASGYQVHMDFELVLANSYVNDTEWNMWLKTCRIAETLRPQEKSSWKEIRIVMISCYCNKRNKPNRLKLIEIWVFKVLMFKIVPSNPNSGRWG